MLDDPRSDSTSSHGEGPSGWDKGKTVDARNWGRSGIPHDELDADTQRREFNMYATARSLRENILDDYDSDEQREMLAYWQAHKAQSQSAPLENQSPQEPALGAASTYSVPPLKQEDVSEQLAAQPALQREVADLHR